MDSLKETIHHRLGIRNPLSYLEKFLYKPIYNLPTPYDEYKKLCTQWYDNNIELINQKSNESSINIKLLQDSLITAAFANHIQYRQFIKVMDVISEFLKKDDAVGHSFVFLTYFTIIAFNNPDAVKRLKREQKSGFLDIKKEFENIKEKPLPRSLKNDLKDRYEMDDGKHHPLLDDLIALYSDDLDQEGIKKLVKSFDSKSSILGHDVQEIRKNFLKKYWCKIHWI